jgi:hypothetical protein
LIATARSLTWQQWHADLRLHHVLCSTNLWPKLQTQFDPKTKGRIIKQGQDFTQHELDNMTLSNQEIHFKMQGTFNQHLYQLQTVASPVLILLARDRIPTLMQEKSFQTLGQKQQVSSAPHTLK